MQFLYNAMFGVHRKGQFYINLGVIGNSWSFSHNLVVKFHGKKIRSQSMTMSYQNPCYILKRCVMKGDAAVYVLTSK